MAKGGGAVAYGFLRARTMAGGGEAVAPGHLCHAT
jgi:hypothetical protein